MFDFSIFSTADAWISLLTLTFLEIVLGVDNIIFISIVAGKLPQNQQKKARNLGLMLALIFRIGLLLSITWIIGLTQPCLHCHSKAFLPTWVFCTPKRLPPLAVAI
jgi:predicted tellurium resistance membrane protein TerC